jgi:hypothetical protein
MSWLLASAAALVAAAFSVAYEDISFGVGVCTTCLVGLVGGWDSCSKLHACKFCLSFIILSSILLFCSRYHLLRYKLFSLYILVRGRPKQNQSAPIWHLPPEIIQYLVDHLPPATAAAFALTRKNHPRCGRSRVPEAGGRGASCATGDLATGFAQSLAMLSLPGVSHQVKHKPERTSGMPAEKWLCCNDNGTVAVQ